MNERRVLTIYSMDASLKEDIDALLELKRLVKGAEASSVTGSEASDEPFVPIIIEGTAGGR